MSAQSRSGGGGGIQIVGYEGSQFPPRVAVAGAGGLGVVVLVGGRKVGGTRVRVRVTVDATRVGTRLTAGGATVGAIGVLGAMVGVAGISVLVRCSVGPAGGIEDLAGAKVATAVDLAAVLFPFDCGLEHATAPLARRAAAVLLMPKVRLRTEAGMWISRRIPRQG